MDVLREEDRRLARRGLLHERDRGRVQSLAGVGGMEFGCDVQPHRQPEDLTSFETGQHLARRGSVSETDVLSHDLAEWQVRDSGAVRKTAPGTCDRHDVLVLQRVPELADEP